MGDIQSPLNILHLQLDLPWRLRHLPVLLNALFILPKLCLSINPERQRAETAKGSIAGKIVTCACMNKEKKTTLTPEEKKDSQECQILSDSNWVSVPSAGDLGLPPAPERASLPQVERQGFCQPAQIRLFVSGKPIKWAYRSVK